MKSVENKSTSNSKTISNEQLPALGIDLGGTKLAAALVSDCKLLSPIKQVPTPLGAYKIIDAILEIIEEFREHHMLQGIGIATAGMINVDKGEPIGATGNIPGWEGTPIKQIIEERTQLPAHVENDANAAAYAECKAAGFQNNVCTITVTLGTGIGVGILFNGKLYRGPHWAAGHAGHIKISLENQRPCTCGLWDCWEAYGSGRGLLATGENLLHAMEEGQSDLIHLGNKLTTHDIVAAAKQRDPIAEKAMSLWHQHVCAGLIALGNTLDPECFVLTGGMSQFVNYDHLRELFVDQALPRVAENTRILPSILGNEAGMIGAAQILLDNLYVATI